jgi:hypothetical protein
MSAYESLTLKAYAWHHHHRLNAPPIGQISNWTNLSMTHFTQNKCARSTWEPKPGNPNPESKTLKA